MSTDYGAMMAMPLVAIGMDQWRLIIMFMFIGNGAYKHKHEVIIKNKLTARGRNIFSFFFLLSCLVN